MRTLWLLSSAALSTLAAAPAMADSPGAPPAAGLGAAPGAALEAAPASGRILVRVSKKGLFSAFAHDHRFEVAAWHATADVPEGDPSGTRVEVVLEAASLHDRVEGLSDAERVEVDAKAAGPDVLDAAHHPDITWRSENLTLEPAAGTDGRVRGTARGRLTVHGVTRAVGVAFDARREGEAWRVEGKGRVKQTDFGIAPFSGFLGTVGVEDEVEIEIALTLRPVVR